VSISSDGKYIAASSMDGTVNLFDEDFKQISTVNGSYSEINWLKWHPKGPVFAFGCNDGSCWVYHAQNIDKNFSFYGHTDSVGCGSFTHSGKYLISSSDDNTSKIWDLKSQTLMYTIKGNKYHKSPIISMAVSKKDIFATGSMNNELAVVNYENGNIVHYIQLGDKDISIEAIEFCNDDRFIVFTASDCSLKILDLSNLQIRIKINISETECVTKIVPSLINSHLLYMSTNEGNFLVFDYRGKTDIVQKQKVHREIINDFVVTKDENYALTSSLDKNN